MIRNYYETCLASFVLGGERIELVPARMRRSADSFSVTLGGGLTAILDLVPVDEEFMRWTVRLRNDGERLTAAGL